MINLNKRYKTRHGCPVRNLHQDMFCIAGEYFENGKWHTGTWFPYSGGPFFGMFSDVPEKYHKTYTLVEDDSTIQEKVSKPNKQLSMF